jgi:hypothetical protein
MNSIESNFVPYQIAVDMKSIGFDEPCLGNYRLPSNRLITEWEIRNTPEHTLGISAPLYQQAFKFFREKYDLHPSFTRYKSSSINQEPTIFTHLYEIQIIDENADKIFHVGDFNSLEEAELECLKKLIKIVKEK